MTGDFFNKLRQRHSTYALGIVTLELEIINFSSVTEIKRIACKLSFENQLFGYIHYSTEININLLLNTCNFHCRFRFTFSKNCSLRKRKRCILEKLNFKISQGSMSQDLPIFVGLTLNCFCRPCCYQWVILSIILHILNTQKDVSFFSRKGEPSVLDIYFKNN